MRPRPARGTPQKLTVTVTDANGRPIPAAGLGRWLAALAPRRARGRVSIALVTDRTMRQLNRRFRGIDLATDVLSFPATDGRAAGPRTSNFELRRSNVEVWPKALGPGPHLGDLAIALGVAGRQAREMGHSLATELRVLALHGLLHLLGYDHETDQGEMGRLEGRLRGRAGLPAGLIARSPSRLRRR